MSVKQTRMVKRIVDVGLIVLLLCLMAYEVCGELLHEWLGVAMTLLVIVHQFLNRRWYRAFCKGKYNAYRLVTTVVTLALLVSFALTALAGMSMSGYAVPFLYGMVKVSLAHRMHLAMSHWSFVLMGLHLGLHLPLMMAKMKSLGGKKLILSAVCCAFAACGFFLFLRGGMINYLFFRVPFAFLDYDKPAVMVFGEHLLTLFFFVFTGAQTALLCGGRRKEDGERARALLPVVFTALAALMGLALYLVFPG